MGPKFLKKSKFVSFFQSLWDNSLSDKCQLHAGALTFITILTLIPFLAFLFAISKGLGIQEYVQTILVSKLALGKQEIFTKILEYVKNTNLKTLGTGGIIFLFLAILKLLGSVENVFNLIWEIKSPRRITRKISDYLTITLLCPIFIFFAMTITTTLSSGLLTQKLFKFTMLSNFFSYFVKILPFISTWIALCIFYMFMPNTKVNLTSGLLSGVVTGTIWQISYWLYLTFQIGITRYSTVYGTFAILPIFMIWVYTSWTVILLGAEFAYVFQNRRRLYLIRKGQSFTLLELGDLFSILKTIVKKFQEGKFPLKQNELLLDFEPAKVNKVLNHLIKYRILSQKDEDLYFVKNPTNVKLEDVISPMNLAGHYDEKVINMIGNVINSEALKKYTLADLL